MEDQVKMVLREAEGISYAGTMLFTWKAPKSSQKFNKDRFQESEPGLYEEYCEATQGPRRFLTK